MKWLNSLLRRHSKSTRAWDEVHRARAAGDWPYAASLLGQALAHAPDDQALRVQYGHALKEAGRVEEALAVYRNAAEEMPHDIDVRVHLAALLRDRRYSDEAISVYTELLAIEPDHIEAGRALRELGGRNSLPVGSLGRDATSRRMEALGKAVAQTGALVADWVAASAYPAAAYDLFRGHHPTPPPPSLDQPAEPIAVLVFAKMASPAMLRVTLDSLHDQITTAAAITVFADAQLAAHPVASTATGLLAPAFASQVRLQDIPQRQVLLVTVGAILNPQALAWLAFCGRPYRCSDRSRRS